MNEIQKFLKKLGIKDKELLIKQILPQIMNNNLDNLDVKKLTGEKNLYRVRQGNIRVIFLKEGDNIKIMKIAFRKNAY